MQLYHLTPGHPLDFTSCYSPCPDFTPGTVTPWSFLDPDTWAPVIKSSHPWHPLPITLFPWSPLVFVPSIDTTAPSLAALSLFSPLFCLLCPYGFYLSLTYVYALCSWSAIPLGCQLFGGGGSAGSCSSSLAQCLALT